MELLLDFLQNTGFGMADFRHFVMIGVGLIFIYLGIVRHYEPLLLVPIGFGILVGTLSHPELYLRSANPTLALKLFRREPAITGFD